MGEAKRRVESGLNNLGLKRVPKQEIVMSVDKCEKCKGEMYGEHVEDFYHDGFESYDLLRCPDCGIDRKFNFVWELY